MVKTLTRGQSPGQAVEVFRGEPTDVAASPFSLFDPATGRTQAMLQQAVSFFESETYALTDGGPRKLPLPLKSSIQGLLDGQLIFTLEEAWTPEAGGPTYPQGALMAADFDAMARGEVTGETVIFAPGPRESIESVGVSKTRVVVAAYENVRGRALVFTPAADGSWTRSRISFPDNLSVDLVDVDEASDLAFIQTANYLQPTTLALADAAAGTSQPVKQLPPRFDASTDVIEQFEAASSDGVKVPTSWCGPRT